MHRLKTIHVITAIVGQHASCLFYPSNLSEIPPLQMPRMIQAVINTPNEKNISMEEMVTVFVLSLTILFPLCLNLLDFLKSCYLFL